LRSNPSLGAVERRQAIILSSLDPYQHGRRHQTAKQSGWQHAMTQKDGPERWARNIGLNDGGSRPGSCQASPPLKVANGGRMVHPIGVGARRRRGDLVLHGAETDYSRLSSHGKCFAAEGTLIPTLTSGGIALAFDAFDRDQTRARRTGR